VASQWRRYERQIEEALRATAEGSDAVVRFDQKLRGKYSERTRQVDVVVEGSFPGLDGPVVLIADCKAWNRKLDVTHVEKFAGLVEDVGAEHGLLICPLGFSDAAERRARHVRGLKLSTVEFELLPLWDPQTVSIAYTTGVTTATVAWRTSEGELRMDVIPADEARRIIRERTGGTQPTP